MTANNDSRMARRTKKKTKNKPLWKKILLSILLLFLAIGIGIGALFTYYIATAPSIDAEKLSDPFSSQVYDINVDLIADLAHDEKRTKIEYDDLPQNLIDAVTSTEDARFFQHHGIDLRRIGGAVLANFKRGFGAEGASTITQQVVERSFLTPEKKIKLKVQEMWLSLKLERQYSKEQILEMYLNKIFYGSHAYGVARAAEVYFGKTDLKELTLPEAAILAGLPQRPTAYNPFHDPELTKKRMKTVLTLMVRHGKITQADADEAMKVDIKSLLVEKQEQATPYEAFMQQVENEVKEKIDGADIYTDGLKIYTTLDPKAQEYVEHLLSNSEDSPIKYPNDSMQSGMVVLDTKTGEIRAIGGRRKTEEGQKLLNYAIQGKFQAGSTAKPIVSYGPAIEYNKISTYHQINDDKPYLVKGTTHSIQNWNRRYQGWMSARYALANSLNVPALKTLEETGLDKAKEFAKGIGYTFANDQITIGDAIGGTDTAVTPLQMAGAFRPFGNEGIYNEPYAVTKVEFPDGKVVDLKPEPKAAMSDYTAYMMTDMLKSVIHEGTGKNVNIAGLPMAGKTGTTNENKDAWFVGYTTNYTISVWSGGYNEDGKKRQSIPDGYTHISQDLFRLTMTELSKDLETPDFKMPSSVVRVGVEKGSNPASLPSSYTPSSQIVTELFVKGTEPKARSEKFDKLDPVKGLKAAYDEDSNSIQVDWQYKNDADVEFEISSSVNGGSMKVLSTTTDTTFDISEVEPGADYTIQVVVVDKGDSSNRSDAVTTKLTLQSEETEEPDEDDEQEEVKNVPPVSNLDAKYDGEKLIVKWNYDGPPAKFEVSVNGQTQTVKSQGIDIKGVQPGQSYTIVVTSISDQQDNIRSEQKSVTIQIPKDTDEDEPVDGDGEDSDSD